MRHKTSSHIASTHIASTPNPSSQTKEGPFFLYHTLAFLIGALLVAGFAPLAWGFLGILCPMMLYGLTQHSISVPARRLFGILDRRGFWAYFYFGIGLYGVGISWVYVSIAEFGGQSPWIAGLLTGLFVGVLSVYTGILGGALGRCSRRSGVQLIAFPGMWVLSEVLRAWILTGFPWLDLGVTQISTPLRGFAPLSSVYGVTGVTLLVAVLGVQLLTLKTWRWVRLISILGLFGIGDILAHVQWTAVDHHHPIPVTLVQGNIAQSLKWEPNMLEHSILTYQELSQAAFSQKNQLIIWPESAIPDTVQDLPTYLAYLNAHLQARHDGLILGILESQGSDQNPAYYNAALGLGRASGVYLKEHLVPFGEYIPFQAELGRVFAWMNIPMSGFSEGPANQAPIRVGGLPVGVFICYEVGYPSLVRQQSRGKAFLVVLSDDAWFGDSLGPWQQAQMAQMRALETGRYVVNSTNNGVTSVIDPEGRVIASIPRGAALTLTSTIYPVSGETPWQRWGV